MSLHDYDIINASGAGVRADLNLVLDAIVGLNSNATTPTTTFAYMWWADTTTGILKQRNAANSAWISVLDLATGVPIGFETTDSPEFAEINLGDASDTTLTRAAAGVMAIEGVVANQLLGDGTAGRVLRVLRLRIIDGTNADTIKPLTTSFFNGDAVAAEDNLGKSGDTGNFTLSADGSTVIIQDSGLSGSAVGLFSFVLTFNDVGTVLQIGGGTNGGLSINFFAGAAGATFDLTTISAGKTLDVVIGYLTDA